MAIAYAAVDVTRLDEPRSTLLKEVRAEYAAMPGLSVTL